MRVALVHDDLVQWGGAEKVLLAIAEIFPDAPIYTSVFDQDNLFLKNKFKGKKIITSFLQKIPGMKFFYKVQLPLYPIAFESFDFSEYDLVISQTTRFAKAVITKPEIKHIAYVHTPPRFLWNFSGENLPKIFLPLLSLLRLYDSITSARVDKFLAGSFNAQKRIKKIYRKDSLVVQPFVDLEKFKNIETFQGDYYLIIARLNSYKKVDVAVRAFSGFQRKLKIVGVGGEFSKLYNNASGNIEMLGRVSDELLLNLIAGCKGLIITAEEDFGMTAIEAQALGKGVVAFKRGGVLETVIENKTGVFFEEQNEESLNEAIDGYEKLELKEEDCRENAAKFSKEIFKERFLKAVHSVL